MCKAVNRVEKSLNRCLRQIHLLLVIWLSKLNSDICKVYAWMSPVDRVGLPYFENFGKPNDRKQLLCIPLCDGIHCQGYIVDLNNNKIIHIDSSLFCNNLNNRTSKKIAKSLFESGTNVQYESLFATRR